jgi:hypothetical protein
VQLPSIPALMRPFSRPLVRPLTSIAGLAAFIRERLADVAPLWARREDGPRALTGGPDQGAVEQAATVIVAAAAPFAPTSFARARLLRQMHASGLLSDRETEQAERLFGVAQSG